MTDNVDESSVRHMYKVVVYDDDCEWLCKLYNLLQAETGQPPGHYTDNWVSLVHDIQCPHKPTLYLFDIVGNELGPGHEHIGIILSKIVQQFGNPSDRVVHFTHHAEIVHGSVHATMNCLATIPKQSSHFTRDLLAAIHRFELLIRNECIIVDSNGRRHFLPTADIAYVESVKRSRWLRVVSHDSGIFYLSGTLDGFLQTMNSGQRKSRRFSRVSKTIVVNTHRLRCYAPSPAMLFFEGGQACEYSQRKAYGFNPKHARAHDTLPALDEFCGELCE